MGFIKIDRKILDSEVFAHDGQLRFWLWLLLRANYKKSFICVNTGSGKTTITVERGQLVFGRNSASAELGVNSSTVYRWVKLFEKNEMITAKSNKHYTVITICKYDEYQTEEKEEITSSEQPANNPRTTREQPANTYKEVKEVKEVKEEDIYADKPPTTHTKKFIIPTIEEINQYAIEKKYSIDAERFFNFYESKDWMIGKNKMKNWKAAVSNWASNDKPKKPEPVNIKNQEIDLSDPNPKLVKL